MTKVAKKKKVAKKVAKKLTGHQFKKGHKESVGYGRPKLSDAQKELQVKTRAQFKEMLDKYLITGLKELEKLEKKKDIPALDAMIIKSLANSIRSGDQSQINWFLNHSMGKPKEVTHLNLSGGTTSQVDVKSLTKEELLAIKAIHDKQDIK